MNVQFVIPRKRPALANVTSTAKAAAVFALFGLSFSACAALIDWLRGFPVWLVVLGLFGISLTVCSVALVAVMIAQRLLPSKPYFPDAFGTLEVAGNLVVQTDDANRFVKIDATRPYEYSILDRYDVGAAVFRLYQDETALTFRYSDPGGQTVVRDVMRLTWPPPARHAGRSYAPPAA